MAWICRFFCDFCETQIQKLKIKESGRQEKHSRKGIWHQKEWWLLCPQRGNLGESMWIEILPRGKCKCSDWTSSTIYHKNYVHLDLSLLWSITFFTLFIFPTSESVISLGTCTICFMHKKFYNHQPEFCCTIKLYQNNLAKIQLVFNQHHKCGQNYSVLVMYMYNQCERTYDLSVEHY